MKRLQQNQLRQTLLVTLLSFFFLGVAGSSEPETDSNFFGTEIENFRYNEGAILVLTLSTNYFSSYTTEILLAEGLNSYNTADISGVTTNDLTNYGVIILGHISLTDAQVVMLSDWVNNGGTLISFRPDPKLASLLGLNAVGGTLADKYLLINTATGPGEGLVGETIQFHSEADLYTLDGAISLATLYSSANTSTSYPAVTSRNIGEKGGKAVAFTYDLARSIVYTRQGNPEWAGQERDGQPGPIRAFEMFYPSWVDSNKIAIPQADEQQRLLANIILQSSQKPLPRFWYLPRGLKAAVVMTGDDHGNGGTRARFFQYLDLSKENTPQAVADWKAIRGSSYIYPNTPLSDTDAKYFQDLGFEIALHLNTNCGNYTAISIDGFLSTQLAEFQNKFPSLSDPVTNRTHCIVFNDWDTQPKAESTFGIRMDANYYYWPDTWVQNNPGFFTGSGFPMRFSDVNGNTIDNYQLATQMTDESGQTYPFTIDQLLDKALGAEAYYGVFCANIHTDEDFSEASDAIISAAQARNVPVISAKQLLDWMDARNSSFYNNIVWNGSAISFSIEVAGAANNLEAMLPVETNNKRLTGLTYSGAPISYRIEKIKGMEYAIFTASSGQFNATYDVNEPPVVNIISPTKNSTFLTSENVNILVEASDPDGEIARVEFYNENIHLGEDTDSNDGWSFDWNGLEEGSYTLFAKAIDNKGSISISEGIFINVQYDPNNVNCPCTVFEPSESAVSLFNENQGIQLGMKFQSEVDGYVNGVRFYKQSGHTGNHVGQLYSLSGELLAEAIFSNETSSGWQEVSFSSSVAISSNTTYIISYHSSEGYYSASDTYFNETKNNLPLKGLANGEDGPNGIYAINNSPTFPTQNFQASNYWVDVVFDTKPTSNNGIPVVTIDSPLQGEFFQAPATILLSVSASDPDGEVVKMEFFNGQLKLGEDVDGRDGWNYSWNDVAAGIYTVTAKATDDLGGSSSAEVGFTVTSQPSFSSSIVNENNLPGNPESEWDINGAGDLSIQGFATDISYNKGETARFKIKTDARDYDIKIYRLGYYQGNGARFQGDAIVTANLPQSQPRCITESETGLLDCGNWEESASWNIPAAAVSGVYLAKLTRNDTGGSSHVLFVVRDDASTSDLLFQTSDATWQAYNIYGDNNNGRSLYTGLGGKAVKVSYNRPFLTRNGGGGGGAEEDWIFNAEYPMIRWIEANGYDVTYTTNVDSDRRGHLIKNHKIFLSVGHDEYWSGNHRQNVEAARNQGTNLAFFSGNEVYWKTRWETSIDGNGVPHRTLVCYKEGSTGENTCSGKCDPSPEWTGLWRSGCEFSSDACQPENALTGQISWSESDAAMTVSSSFRDLRFWRNTSVASLNDGQSVSFTYGTIGYEWNAEQEEYKSFYPDGRILLSRTSIDGDIHNISLYKHNSGALVFGAGTVQWSWGLDSNHDRGDAAPSRDMQQATVNLFADMGVQPGSIQSELVKTTPSSDFEAPVISFTAPLEGATIPNNNEVIVTGSVVEENTLVAVEISTDEGLTWNVAEGEDNWIYTWTPTVEGPTTIQARGLDDSGNLSLPVIINLTVSDTFNNASPVVDISQPADFSVFTAPADILISATASDVDGTISKVEFFNGSVKIGEDLTSPFSLSWNDILEGIYTITARATDNDGAVGVSDIINVTVNKNGDNSNCPCSVFQATDIPGAGLSNDGTPIQLGMKFRSNVDGVVTGVRFYKQVGDPGIHIGQLYNPAGVVLAQATFSNESDSGWQQVNFPDPVEITAETTYIISYHSSDGYYTVSDSGFEQAIVNGPLRGLGSGEDGPNGVYRYSAVPTFPFNSFLSSNYWVDVVFNKVNMAPVVAITSPLEAATFTAPADILITADASDTDGTVVSVEFFEGTNSLGIDSDGNDGWSLTWTGAVAGTYALTAVATDDKQESTTSSAVNIEVTPANTAPIVAITAPLEAATFTAPADILITADASDTDGTVVSVEFFEGTNSLGIDSDGNDGWSLTWTGAVAGTYALTAVATDDKQESTTSAAVNIEVTPANVAPSVAITSPLEGASFTVPADILITADASDTDGTVVSVEFFEGTNSLG
ncbi:N,N-dimethylformamidase beta subunit family domain-containing protein, partial [Salinimicrobium sp. TH3]|uniref:N,N-dimethylformamidase beta subunit family domain-containing protein n=1 Tax=Salinimicrobium sp. TH3 TaxID=2997342 RepID=UPI0022743A48